MFAELADNAPDNVSYFVLRLDDDSFLHLSFHAHGHDDPEPDRVAASLPALPRRPRDSPQWRSRPATSDLVGSYVAVIG